MDTATTTTNPSRKSPEPESETPTRIHHAKAGSLTNGVLKRHHHSNHHAPPVVVVYRECLKNHAATIGGHALDGCGEFMPSPESTAADPTSLKCAACGCHRNFHRRDPDDSPLPPPPPPTHVIEYHPHHRHHPPPPPPRSPNSASPPPISSSYMLLALSSGPDSQPHPPLPAAAGLSRKRFRTKFSQSQKERMLEFAGRVGWKVQKRDEDLIQEFCHEIGVDRNVLKVWMHNNKNTFGKNKDGPAVNGGNPGDDDDRSHHIRGDDATQMGTNGSSSSS